MTMFEKLAKEFPEQFVIDESNGVFGKIRQFRVINHRQSFDVDEVLHDDTWTGLIGLYIMIADTIGVKIWAEPYDFNQVWAGRWYKSLSSAGTVAHRFDTQHKAFLAALEAAVDETKGQPE